MIPFEPMWEQFNRIIKDNEAILLFGQDKFTAKLMLSNEKMHRYNIIWDKVLPSGFLNAKQKPLELCRYAIRTYSNEGDVVLDCCYGSGTIPLAAKIENRKYIGMDNGICTKKGKYYGQFWAAITAERIRNYG